MRAYWTDTTNPFRRRPPATESHRLCGVEPMQTAQPVCPVRETMAQGERETVQYLPYPQAQYRLLRRDPGTLSRSGFCRIRTRTRSRNVLCAAKRGGDTGHVRRFGKIRVHSPGDDIRGIRQYLRQGKVRKSGGMDKKPAAVVLFHPPGIQPVQQEEFMDQGRMLFPHRRKEAA